MVYTLVLVAVAAVVYDTEEHIRKIEYAAARKQTSVRHIST